jgi:hypothetical protein
MNASAIKNALLVLVSPRYRDRLVAQAGGEVARCCQADLWGRVRRPAQRMSTPELRGYARAHAAPVAGAQVDQILVVRGLSPALRVRVLASSIDQLVAMAIRNALSDDAPAEARPLAA